MSINPDALIETVKRAGRTNTRVVPTTEGKVKIEINENGNWRSIQEGISATIASSIVEKATKGIILG